MIFISTSLHFYYFKSSNVVGNAQRRWLYVLVPVPPGNGRPACNFSFPLKPTVFPQSNLPRKATLRVLFPAAVI